MHDELKNKFLKYFIQIQNLTCQRPTLPTRESAKKGKKKNRRTSIPSRHFSPGTVTSISILAGFLYFPISVFLFVTVTLTTISLQSRPRLCYQSNEILLKPAGRFVARTRGRRSGVSSGSFAYCMQSEKLAHRVDHYYTISRVRGPRDGSLRLLLLLAFIPVRACSQTRQDKSDVARYKLSYINPTRLPLHYASRPRIPKANFLLARQAEQPNGLGYTERNWNFFCYCPRHWSRYWELDTEIAIVVPAFRRGETRVSSFLVVSLIARRTRVGQRTKEETSWTLEIYFGFLSFCARRRLHAIFTNIKYESLRLIHCLISLNKCQISIQF